MPCSGVFGWWPGMRFHAPSGHVNVRHLGARVHPGVGTPRNGDAHLVGARELRKRALEHALHRAQIGLDRPARKVGAVVRKNETGPHDLFSHGARLVLVNE